MTDTPRRRLLLGTAATVAATSLAAQRPAFAQPAGYPYKPIKLIVVSPAGGLTDNYARMLAPSAKYRGRGRERASRLDRARPAALSKGLAATPLAICPACLRRGPEPGGGAIRRKQAR